MIKTSIIMLSEIMQLLCWKLMHLRCSFSSLILCCLLKNVL